MRRGMGMAVLAAAAMAVMTAGLAMAGEREQVGNVTILRGMSPSENVARPATVPMIGSSVPAVTETYSVDVNGRLKELSITRPATLPNGAGQ